MENVAYQTCFVCFHFAKQMKTAAFVSLTAGWICSPAEVSSDLVGSDGYVPENVLVFIEPAPGTLLLVTLPMNM